MGGVIEQIPPPCAPLALTDAQILNLWEAGVSVAASRRSAAFLRALLAAAFPGEAAFYEELPAGEWNRRAILWRAAFFGKDAPSVARCPRCAETSEIALPLSALLAAPLAVRSGAWTGEGEAANWAAVYRTPTVADIEQALASVSGGDTDNALFARCVTVTHDGQESGDVPESVTTAITAAMADGDPLADIEIAASCPVCGAAFAAALDPAAFVFAEVEVYARRLLRQVHRLARAYGWREADVLALSAARRRMYLDLVGE